MYFPIITINIIKKMLHNRKIIYQFGVAMPKACLPKVGQVNVIATLGVSYNIARVTSDNYWKERKRAVYLISNTNLLDSIHISDKFLSFLLLYTRDK